MGPHDRPPGRSTSVDIQMTMHSSLSAPGEKRMTGPARSGSLRWIWLLILFAAPVLLVSLTQDIGAVAYDAATEHIYRGVSFSDVIDDGVLYPRWTQSLHWGLGSPLFTFQPPIPYYGMDLLHRLGLSHPLGWRCLVAGGFGLAFLGAYLLVREITGRRWPALVAAVAYLYAPYVLRNALERGSNEAYSMFLYPLVLWSLLWLAKQPGVGRFLLATLVWAACIGSHVLGPLMVAPFAGLLAIFLWWRHRTAAPLLALVAGGLLMAFIWLPMAQEPAWVHVQRDFTQVEAIPANNPIPLDQLLAPPVVYDVARDNNNVGDRAGLVHSILLALGIPAILVAWRRNRRIAYALLAATAAGLFLFCVLSPAGDGFWRLGGSLLARLLYRTRLMGVQALAAAIVAGLLVAILPPRWQRAVGMAVAAALVLIALPSLYVQLQHHYTEFQVPVDLRQVRTSEIASGGSALTAFGEFTPLARTAPFDDKQLAELGDDFDAARTPLASDAVQLRSANVRNQAWDLEISAATATTATLHLLYYPRWEATVDGAPSALAAQEGTGYVQLAVPAGDHTISLRYGMTTYEQAGLLVSGLCALLLILASGRALWRRRARAASPGTGARTEPPASDAQPEPAALPLWSLVGLTALLVLKIAVVDPHTTWFRCASTRERVCGAQMTTDVPFVGAPRLRGFAVESYHLNPGEQVRLEVYWEGIEGMTDRLWSFVHVRPSAEGQPGNPRAENGMWAQDEHVAPGGLLTDVYVPGKLYRDVYRLHLPEDMPPGEYFLEIGWFNPETGEQADVPPEAVREPLRVLWRSVLLPNLRVETAATR